MCWSKKLLVLGLGLGLHLSCPAWPAPGMDVVRDGRPLATIVVDGGEPAAKSRRRAEPGDDRQAAAVLVDWVRKMTDAELPVAASAPDGKPAIYVGAAAARQGLKLNDIQSPSHEGLRIQCDGRRVLLAGQDGTATVKAACRLLEQWGCRYFLDHPLGEVYPRTETLVVDKVDIAEKPGFLMRSIWGSQWGGPTLWKTWNGAGGISLPTGHSWGQYVPKNLFQTHPEFFALRGGQRRAGDWYCTSNPGLREEFARGVAARIGEGGRHMSISPPDGRGYCECDRCRAQDDPRLLEPSSGHVCVTNRYLDFYQDVARSIAKKHPDSILSFYCYADYTQAPSRPTRLEPNLCAWIAPIRYCRFHHIGQAECPTRAQLAQQMDAWGAAAQRLGYRTYNYNLAECLVPFSMMSVWKHDIPYLKQKGAVGVNLETLTNWQIYGPHIYLSIRLGYDPGADADAVMDDYFLKFYGPQAGPIMKQYWMAIDRAFAQMPCHSGSFFALHLVYTPEFLRQCQERLRRAAAAARSDQVLAARVQMAAEGLRNAEQYITVREALQRGEPQAAERIYADLLARNKAHQESKLGNHYTVGYLQRFLGPAVQAGFAATKAPARLVAVAPDRWRLAYDETDQGVAKGFYQSAFDDSSWREVATFRDTLDAQGLPDRPTILWYRAAIDVPRAGRKLALVFLEVDGDAKVYVNGREVGASAKKRVPFEVNITPAAVAGRNVVAVRVDHSQTTELMLGGIVRPVYLVEKER